MTLGETLAVLHASRLGPLRHARTFELGVAGCESNVAIGVARLGHVAAWVGRVGDDEFGRAVLSTLRGEGVEVTAAVVDPAAPTALMVKERRSADLSRVVYYRKGSAGSHLEPADVPEALVGSAQVVHTSAITAALGPAPLAAVRRALDVARSAGTPVSFDLNYRSALWAPAEAGRTMRDLIPLAGLVFGGRREFEVAVGTADPEAALRSVAGMGPAQVVMTLGSDGAVAWVDGSLVHVPAVPVTMADPVGAGDGFVAGYLAGLLDGAGAVPRLEQAARVAAMVVGAHGDWEGLPDRRELSQGPVLPGEVHR